jgi:hypothetical protein
MEGEFQGRDQQLQRVAGGSGRFAASRRTDSLQVGGGSMEASRKDWAVQGERAATVRHQDNLRVEAGEFTGKKFLIFLIGSLYEMILIKTKKNKNISEYNN